MHAVRSSPLHVRLPSDAPAQHAVAPLFLHFATSTSFFSFTLIHHEAPFSSFRRIAHDSRTRHPQPDTRQQCVSQISLRSRLPGHSCQADHHPRSSPQATSSCATPQSRTTPRARSTSSSPPGRASGRSRPRPSRARGRPSGPCSRTAP